MGRVVSEFRGWVVRFIFPLSLLLSLCVRGYAQQDTVSHDERSAYLLRFAREIRWPNFDKQSNFYIEIVGPQSRFVQDFMRHCATQKVGDKPIQVFLTTSWAHRTSFHYPHMVYVMSSAMHDLPHIHRLFSGFPVLVVSERPYFQSGWMVSLLRMRTGSDSGSMEWGFALNDVTIEREAGLDLPESLHSTYTPPQAVRQAVSPSPSLREEQVPGALQYVTTANQQLNVRLAEQESVIEEQEFTILRQRDTIHLQRGELERLSLENYLLSQSAFERDKRLVQSWLLWLRPEVSAVQLSSEGEEFSATSVSLNLPVDRSSDWNVRGTAPWSSPASGFLVLFSLAIISLVGVLGSLLFSSLSNFSLRVPEPVSPSHASVVAGGALASVAAHRSRKESDTQHAYSQQLELELARRARAVASLSGEVERSNRLKSSFLANVSHEIRTPLNAIVGLSQFVASSPGADSELRENLEIINENAFGLMDMMNNILTLAMLDSGDVELKTSECDLQRLFDSLFEKTSRRLRKLDRESLVSLHYTRGAGVPVFFVCDAEKLATIMEILLAQALLCSLNQSIEFGCRLAGSGGELLSFYVEGGFSCSSSDMLVEEGVEGLSERAQEMISTELDLGMSVAKGLAEFLGSPLDFVLLEGNAMRVSFSLPLN